MFFFFFFLFLFCPVLQRPLFPTCRVLKPPSLHRASPLKPRKSPPPTSPVPGPQVKVCFFFFFVPSLPNPTHTPSTPHAGPSTPRLSTTPSLSPCPAPQASQVRTAVAS